MREHEEKCKLDIYLHLCEQDYVGDDLVDNALNVQEVCRKIGALQQVGRRVEAGRRWTPLTTFNKYLQLSMSLSMDAILWPIQLCSSYLLCYHQKLQKG